mmetsp:Transcript_37076/g.80737  ORF Transcript_37076/g.80737 Transcript_37076/m.80737 type:complete len:261 (+) Transcript_37076:219-1001(+)
MKRDKRPRDRKTDAPVGVLALRRQREGHQRGQGGAGAKGHRAAAPSPVPARPPAHQPEIAVAQGGTIRATAATMTVTGPRLPRRETENAVTIEIDVPIAVGTGAIGTVDPDAPTTTVTTSIFRTRSVSASQTVGATAAEKTVAEEIDTLVGDGLLHHLPDPGRERPRHGSANTPEPVGEARVPATAAAAAALAEATAAAPAAAPLAPAATGTPPRRKSPPRSPSQCLRSCRRRTRRPRPRRSSSRCSSSSKPSSSSYCNR